MTEAADLGLVEFEAMLMYDDGMTAQILDAMSAELGRPLPEVLEDLGTYLVSNPNTEDASSSMNLEEAVSMDPRDVFGSQKSGLDLRQVFGSQKSGMDLMKQEDYDDDEEGESEKQEAFSEDEHEEEVELSDSEQESSCDGMDGTSRRREASIAKGILFSIFKGRIKNGLMVWLQGLFGMLMKLIKKCIKKIMKQHEDQDGQAPDVNQAAEGNKATSTSSSSTQAASQAAGLQAQQTAVASQMAASAGQAAAVSAGCK